MSKSKTNPAVESGSASPPPEAPSNSADPATAPWVVGENYFIRTVTMYHVGKLVWVGQLELVLDSASWVADTGRFHSALAQGKFNEVEPFPSPVIIGRNAIIDATRWTLPLPTKQV